MSKPYIIRVSSQKGGVGKTCVAVNLATALKQDDYKVLLLDADTINPSVGFHLGIDEVNVGIWSVFKGKMSLKNAIAIHNPTGLHVLPGAITAASFIISQEMLRRMGEQLSQTSYDFVIVDTAPGFFDEGVTHVYNEALVLSTPDISSATSALRLARLYNKRNIKHSLVLNMVKNKRYELHVDEVEEIYEDRVMVSLPYDEKVPISVATHIPLYLLDKRSPFSRGIRDLSRNYATRIESTAAGRGFERGGGIFGFFRRLFGQ